MYRLVRHSSIGILLASVVACVSAPSHPPAPPPALRLDVAVYGPSGAIAGALVDVLDGPNKGIHGTTGANAGNVILTGLKPGGMSVCASAPGMVKACVPVTLVGDSNTQIHLLPAKPPDPPVVAAPVLHPDGRIFRTADGKAWRYKGVSAFALFDRITRGEDVRDTLNAYKGYNVLRVWPYVPKADWGARAWDVTYTASDAKAYLAKLAELGWTVELTLLTDDDPGRLAWAKTFVRDLTTGGCPSNLLLEAGNEPLTHKHIDVDALRPVFEASGCRSYTSGIYEDMSKAWGTYFVVHSQRDRAEWMRRAHDCKEVNDGGGPNKPTDPKHSGPCALDEPAKPGDVAPNADDWRAYFGAAALMSGGATFHSETGKWGLPPTPQEAELAAAALEGLNAFPADAPTLGYGRPVENSLRTYTAGDRFMVRVRPTSPTPGAGWTRIGSSNVLWKR